MSGPGPGDQVSIYISKMTCQLDFRPQTGKHDGTTINIDVIPI